MEGALVARAKKLDKKGQLREARIAERRKPLPKYSLEIRDRNIRDNYMVLYQVIEPYIMHLRFFLINVYLSKLATLWRSRARL